MYTDRAITCLDCGQEFTFTAGEQEFYEQRGFTEPPKRCPSCRSARKAQRQSSGYGNGGDSYGSSYGGYGASGGSYGTSGSYGGNSGSGAAGFRDRPQRELFDAVCGDCGKTARVPFRPSGARPVYCSDCFQSRR